MAFWLEVARTSDQAEHFASQSLSLFSILSRHFRIHFRLWFCNHSKMSLRYQHVAAPNQDDIAQLDRIEVVSPKPDEDTNTVLIETVPRTF